MAFDPPQGAPAPLPPPALRRGFVTFGSFNALAKITPQVIAVWARLLRAVPAARLMMLTVAEGEARDRITRAFAAHGVPASRLSLAGRLGFDAFLAAFADADIALDPFPFAGTTTTCQTLWMGVPVVTLAGASHAGRVGVSMLTNVGLADLVARDEDDYVAVAATLAGDSARMAELRAGMRERMLASPLTDGARLARAVENAYRTMWDEHCRAPGERNT
jgi:predicted O-linked N-acetylglucosamine transferase (SPINDLY family)